MNTSVTPSCSNRLRFCNLGATKLFHSVTSTGSGYKYPRVRFWKILQNPSARVCPALPPRVSGSSPRCQRPPAIGFCHRRQNLLRRHRRSEHSPLKGTCLTPCAVFFTPIPSTRTMPCFLPRMRLIYPAKSSLGPDGFENFRVSSPQNSAQTDRNVEIGLIDSALAIAHALFGPTETCKSV